MLLLSEWSKNYYLKIPVRARMYARMYDYGPIVIRTHDHDQHTTGTRTNGTQDTNEHDHRKREERRKKFAIGGRSTRKK